MTQSEQVQHPSTAVVLAVGDIGPDRDDAGELFEPTRELLRSADVTFGQLEFVLAESGQRLPQVRHTVRGNPKAAYALADNGFDVISFAGNHCMDFGADAMLETVTNLRAAHLQPVGVGANVEEARQAAVLPVDDGEVSVLSYSSILPHSFWATENRPGCAPMRAFTVYEQIEHDQPGTPARIHTFAHRDDLASLRSDIEQQKSAGRFVIASFHWGIHFIPAEIADYQRDVARAAVDAGADVVIGHHSHILKGIEIYKGVPIFYSLANFAMDTRVTPEQVASKSFQEILALNPGWVPDYESTFNFPPDSRKTIIAKFVITEGALTDYGFFPGWINDNSQTVQLAPADPRFEDVVDYMAAVTRQAGLNTEFRTDGDFVRPEALTSVDRP